MTLEERFDFLNQSIESHDRQLGEITDRMSDLTYKVDALTGMMGQLLGAMKTLAETVTTHERRITGLEGAA
jgi:hypothetical protein